MSFMRLITTLILSIFILSGCNLQSHKDAIVIAYGSSTLAYMSTGMNNMVSDLGAKYISNARGGQIIETLTALQGSSPILLTFKKCTLSSKGMRASVQLKQENRIGDLNAKGSFNVVLSNKLKGVLDLDREEFKINNTINVCQNKEKEYVVNFGYTKYRKNGIHIFNIGKNNITKGNYSVKQIIEAHNTMVEFIKTEGNNKFIVAGYFVDRGMNEEKKQAVLGVNAALKAKYGLKYFDMQDYLMSAQIWTDLNITPTQDDLDKQALGELAVSLSRDAKHLSADVDTLIVERLKQKLQTLGYL